MTDAPTEHDDEGAWTRVRRRKVVQWGLADALSMQVAYSGAPLDATLAEVQETTATALRLDPDLGEAWASSGMIAKLRDQPDQAELAFRRAIELSPSYMPARMRYGVFLRDAGRLDEAIVQGERAVALDPLSGPANMLLGDLLNASGKYGDAEVRCRKAIAIDPAMPEPYALIAQVEAYAFGPLAEAIPLAEKAVALDPGSPAWRPLLTWLWMEIGDMARQRAALAARPKDAPLDLAPVR